jgi:hypothetical protein
MPFAYVQVDKLNDKAHDMVQYRAALDAERDALLSRGVNHAELRKKRKGGSSAEGEAETKGTRACMRMRERLLDRRGKQQTNGASSFTLLTSLQGRPRVPPSRAFKPSFEPSRYACTYIHHSACIRDARACSQHTAHSRARGASTA